MTTSNKVNIQGNKNKSQNTKIIIWKCIKQNVGSEAVKKYEITYCSKRHTLKILKHFPYVYERKNPFRMPL